MQAIRTRYYGQSNVRGSRIQAKCEARTIYVPYDHALDLHDNHVAAREALLDVMGWRGDYYAGMTCGEFGGDYYHAFTERGADEFRIVEI